MTDKLKAYRDSLTPEQKVEALQRAQQARKDKSAGYKANEHLYTLEYMDSNLWQELAQEAKFKMPAYNRPCTTSAMRKIMRTLKVDAKQWIDDVALKGLQQWIDLNPKHTAYAFAGNILEWRSEYSNKP